MDSFDVEVVKSAIERMFSADADLSSYGYCGVTHDSLNNRNYLQATGRTFYRFLKDNNLTYSVKKYNDEKFPIEIVCDELKTYAIYSAKDAIDFGIITEEQTKDF